MPRARHWVTEGSKEGEESETRAPHRFGPSAKLHNPIPQRERETEAVLLEKAEWGGRGGAVALIIKHNGEKQTQGKTKGSHYLLGSKLRRQEGRLWMLRRGYCLSNQAEIGYV